MPTGSLPKLDGLPGELMTAIAEHLPRVDILNLGLTCKRLQEDTESELYREFVQSQLNPACLRKLQPSSSASRV
jgi:hypothetical protein